MDYNDNEFQGQNTRLVGEDNSRFPPGIRSYALPKFDLDEQLQVHLRFDSLVETEILLGIENQEHHWIEDYSRGSSGILVLDPVSRSIESESCSISRRNNVWSEATSSESVEMLLNSVGQDDMITKQSVSKEYDASDLPMDTLNGQMDPKLSKDDAVSSKIGDAFDVDPMQLPTNCPKSSPGLIEDAAGDLSDIEDMPETHEFGLTVYNNFLDQDRSSVDERCGVFDKFIATHSGSEGNVSSFQEESTEHLLMSGNYNEELETQAMDLELQKDNLFMEVPLDEKDAVNSNCSAASGGDFESMQVDDSSVTPLQNVEQITEGSTEVLHEENPGGLLEDGNHLIESEISGPNTVMNDQYIKSTGEELEGNQTFQSHSDESHRNTSGNPSLVAKMDAPLDITHETKEGLHIKDGDSRLETNTEDSNCRDTHSVMLEKKIQERVENDTGIPEIIINNDDVIVAEHGPTLPDLHSSDVTEVCNKKLSDPGSAMDTTVVFQEAPKNDTGSPDVIINNHDDIVAEQGSTLPDLHSSDFTEVCNKKLSDPGLVCNKKLSDPGLAMDTTVVFQEAPKNGNDLVVTELLVLEAQNFQNTESDSSILAATSGTVVGEVSGDITDSTSYNNHEDVHSVLPDDNLESNDAIEEKEVEALDSPTTLSDEMGELVDGDSMKPGTSAMQDNIIHEAGSGIHLDAVQVTNQNSAVESVPEKVTCSSVSVEKFELETVHDSVMGERDISEVPKASSQKYGATSLHATGDLPNPNDRCCSGPEDFSKENSESLPMGPGIDSTIEGDCGSPTIISCSERSQSEMDHQGGNEKSSVPNNTVSEDLPCDSSHVDAKIDKFESVSDGARNDDSSGNDKSFTFEVGSLVTEATNLITNKSSSLATETDGKGWKPFRDNQPVKLPQPGESFPIPPGSYESNQKLLEENPQENHQSSNEQKAHSDNKELSADKSRSLAGSGNKGAVEEGKVSKEISCSKHKATTSHEDGISCCASASTGETLPIRAMQAEERRLRPVTPVQASGLPDLNTSVTPASVLFQQPFTDLQQIQLRAQIFVYGSLIQGTVPDEACMISAFGESGRDGGRNVWENVWRIAAERLHNQKSPVNPETPIHSRSGLRISEQASRCSPLQNKTPSTPAGRTGMKGAPQAILNTSNSLPSPVWSTPTPSREGALSGVIGRGPLLESHQTVAPLHLYQSPHIRHYFGPNNPWPSQQPCPVPWFFSPQTSAFDVGPHYSTLPTSETVQVTPVRDHPGVPSIPHSSNVQPSPSSPLPSTVGSLTVPVSTGTPVEGKRKPGTPGRKPSSEQKPRKRKKSLLSEEVGHGELVQQPQTESPPATNANKPPAPVSVFTPNPASKVTSYATNSTITAPTHYQIIFDGNSEQRVTLSEETCGRIELAKLQAEDAAALAASAVRHSQGIWSQLDAQKNTGLLSEVEAKLASAAVSAAAAASVAKAAAAAAKVACDAALQAKLMADEALNFTKIGNSSRGSETGLLEGRKNMGKVTLSSILKGKDKTDGSSSVISVAREAARKRVEAASAAAKQAENLDAVVRAAELAAEAVSLAGAVIVMGDPVPLTLSELVETGSDGFWKVYQAKNNQMGEPLNVEVASGSLKGSSKHVNERFLSKKEIRRSTLDGKTSSVKEISKQSMENQKEFVNGLHRDSVVAENGLGKHRGRKVSDLVRTVGVVPETETGPKGVFSNAQNDDNEKNQQAGHSKENSIKEGSLVEVVSDEEGLRRVWFSAKVLSLKDGKAYVCYNELLSDEGRGQLKEWVPLEGEGDNAPRIRIAHPVTDVKFEGTRKRRRAAMGNYVWSVGDRVDAWMRDGWWEGIVAEKYKDDENKFTVNFPAEGDSVIVRSWNLRPSLIWKNGQWIELARSGESNPGHYEGDTPRDKRQKLGNSQVDARGREVPKDLVENSKKLEDSRPLALTAKEKMFTAGKSFKDENNSAALRVQRTGLQKEGSKVVFGVPKPGKKKKFMDVSKHYVTDKAGKINEGNDSIKFTQYLMPQSSRGLRHVPKVDFKDKRPTDSKHKVPKSGKSQSIQTKSRSEKDGSSISHLSASDEATGRDPLPSTKDSFVREENKFEKQKMLEVGYFSNALKPAEGPVLISSLEQMPDVPPSRKRSSSDVNLEQGMKGKLAPADEKLVSDEEKASIIIDIPVKPISDASEPRRSNRRIQPTSRLLEGLQSSPVIPKASVSNQDKASRTQNRNASSLKGNNHG